MRFNYDEVDWRYVAGILNENSMRLSRTRAGISDTSTSTQKHPLLLKGDALREKSAQNEARVHQFLFQTRRDPAPRDPQRVLDLIWNIADLTNAGLLPFQKRFREWPSEAKVGDQKVKRVDVNELPDALHRFAVEVHRRWPELDENPVQLAAWAEWELNGGSLHPFYDGCGRISRSFGALLLLRASWRLPLYQDLERYFVEGNRGTELFAEYVLERIQESALWQEEIVDLNYTWEDVEKKLAEFPKIDMKTMQQFFKEGTEAKQKGFHFFGVQYKAGTNVMAKGDMGDYAAIHLSGVLHVRHAVPNKSSGGLGCWSQTRLRRLENIVLNHDKVPPVGKRSAVGRLLDSRLAALSLDYPSIPLSIIFLLRFSIPCFETAKTTSKLPGTVLQRLLNSLPVRICGWGNEKWATRAEIYFALILRGRMKETRRKERELARPTGGSKKETATPLLSKYPSKSNENDNLGGAGGQQQEKVITIRDKNNNLLPAIDRLMGITSTIWNQPRSVTLEAGDDPDDHNAPCRMLLIKRKALLEIFKTPDGKKLLEKKLSEFVTLTLPSLLAENRFFRNMVYVEEVEGWDDLLACLRGTPTQSGRASGVRYRLAELVDDDLRKWLAKNTRCSEEADKARVVSSLNRVLANRAVPPTDLTEEWFPFEIRSEAARLIQRHRDSPTLCETFRLNRLLFEVACPGAIQQNLKVWPLFPEDFREFAETLALTHKSLTGSALQPLLYEKNMPVPKENEKAAFFLIMSGMLRVYRDLPGGESTANNLDGGGYFGERAILDDNDLSTPPPSRVQTLCKSYLLPLERATVEKLVRSDSKYEVLIQKLQREKQRIKTRDQLFINGSLLIPQEPPPEIADRLALTRNLLLIDMDLCTRCDQCVKGCASAHDMQPRFHRANPSLRFGKWEVAGACMNCLDAPCLDACPVGAITFLDDKSVQIHRTRCVGCGNCSRPQNGCPFGVIDMYPGTSPKDAPNLWRTYKDQTVATKCDLCLTEDHDPPCVAWCPYDAAMRVDPAEKFKSLKGRGVFASGQSEC